MLPITCSTKFLNNAMASNLGRYKAMRAYLQLSMFYSTSTKQSIQESVRAAVEAKNYLQIPDLINPFKPPSQNANPFSFLATLPDTQRVSTVDEILQSFIPYRPREKLGRSYSCLLSCLLQTENPLPLSLAVLQRTLRSGCTPVPQTHMMLSSAWLRSREQCQSVSSILLRMCSIGYSVDCGTCNYLILSLCKVGQLEEAAQVLRGMRKAGCAPDLDGYGTLIGEMSERRMTSEVVEMVKEMISVHGFHPRQDIVVKGVKAMCANRDVWRAVEVIEFLESNVVHVGFEAYQLVLEGCLECCEFILAGKFVVGMTERGFIPYIRTRHMVVEGLNSVGESELASVVRGRFSGLKS